MPDRSWDDARAGVVEPGATEPQFLPWLPLLRQRLTEKAEGSGRYPTIVLATALFGLFTVGFTITILAVSLSTIAEDLGSSKTTLTWAITGPLLAFGVVGPAAGKAGDIWGHRRVYLIGLLGEAVFALGIALAWDAGSLITFRILSAAAGAAAGPASMALIYSVFPPHRRVQAMGWWSMVMAGGPVLGVVAGGPVVEALSWRWIFIIQVPLVLFGALVAALLLPETEKAETRTRFDFGGAVLLAAGVTSLLLALNRGPLLGWTSPVVLVAFGLCPALLWAFVRRESRIDHPLVKVAYLRRRNVAAPVTTQFFTNFAYMGGFILTPFLLAEVFGYGATRIGLISISRPLAFAIAGPLGGWVAMRVGERRAGMAGALAVTASMLCLASLDGSAPDGLVMFSLALSGLGLGASAPSMAATVANAVDPEDLGVAGAASQLLAQIGTVAGIQLMQTVQVSREAADGLATSYQLAYLLGGLVAACGIASAAFVRRSNHRADARRDTTAEEERALLGSAAR